LDEAKEAVGFAEAGLKEELRRREKLEQQLHTLESLSQEHIEKNLRLTKELEELCHERSSLQNDLAAERQTAAQSKERVQTLQTRLDQQTAELAKLQADFEQRTLARDRAEAAVREQLGKAEAQKKEVEAAWAEALACNHQFQKDIAGLREERDVHQGKLSAEQQSASESKKHADELQARLRQSAADLERSQTDLKRQQAELERAQAEWREQLEKAQAQANELRATCAEVTESKQHLQEDLTHLREQHDELNRKLAAEQRAAAESSRRAAELQTRLTQATVQIEQAQAELENQQTTRDRARADWQQQLTAAQERCDELTAAQTAAKEQNTRLEEKLSASARTTPSSRANWPPNNSRSSSPNNGSMNWKNCSATPPTTWTTPKAKPAGVRPTSSPSINRNAMNFAPTRRHQIRRQRSQAPRRRPRTPAAGRHR